MRRFARTPGFVLICVPLLLGGCRLGAEVMRVEGGQPVPGRWISPSAYASFLEGSLAEAAGHPSAAVIHYQRALDEDPAASEAWTRLGAVQCTSDRRRSDEAFARAVSVEPTLSAAWLASAECHLARGDTAKAKQDAEQALRLSPKDAEVTRVLAATLDRLGDAAGALRLRRGYALLSTERVEPAAAPDLDAALAAGDEDGIRRGSLRARVPLSHVALRAVRVGRTHLAETTAERALAAEPGNADALVALLVARDLLGKGDDAIAAEALPSARSSLSPLGRELMVELLARRGGDTAAKAFAEAAP